MWYLWHWTDAEFKEQVWLQAKKKDKKRWHEKYSSKSFNREGNETPNGQDSSQKSIKTVIWKIWNRKT